MLERSFRELSKRCIALIKNINYARIDRKVPASDNVPEQHKDVEYDEKEVWVDKAKGTYTKPEPIKSVTLSGLLDAIDGACTHEGRLLIMTTNALASWIKLYGVPVV